MKIKTKRILAVILVACLSVGFVIPALAADYTARVINVFRTEGEVSLLSGSARAVTPRVGQRLSVDDTLQTGENSSVHLRLDRETLLQMDENSIVTVESAGRQLVLSIEEGRAFIHAEPQEEGNTIETRVGNVGLTIRGTMYTMGLDADGYTNIVMLSGSGDVNDTMLYAGNVMVLDEDGQYTLEELSLENLDPFTLQAVYDNMEYLMNAGTLTADMLPLLNALVAELVIIIRPPVTPAPANTPVESPPAQDNRSWDQDDVWVSPPQNPTPPAPPPADVTPEVPEPPPADVAPESPAPPEPPPVDVAPETPDYDYDYDYDYDDTENGDGSSGRMRRPPRVDGVYQIRTVAHLRWVQSVQWWGTNTSRNFVLVNTEPLVINFMIPVLNGTFNGNGRTIDVRLCSNNYNSFIPRGVAVGLFSSVGRNGVVHDLNVITHINTTNHNIIVGGLVGINDGTIRNVTVQNNGVTGNDIVGHNRGTLTNVTVVSSQPVAAAASLDIDLDFSFGYDFYLDDTYDYVDDYVDDYVAPDNYDDPVDCDDAATNKDDDVAAYNVTVDSDGTSTYDNYTVDTNSAEDDTMANKDDGDDDDDDDGDDDSTDDGDDDGDDVVNP